MAISLNSINTRVSTLEKRNYGYLFPDYSKAVQLANSSSGYTPPSNGYISFDFFEDGGSITYLTVNGRRFFQGSDASAGQAEGTISGLLPVTTSDKLTWWVRAIGGSYNGMGIFFIPAKTLYYKVLESINRFFKEVIL